MKTTTRESFRERLTSIKEEHNVNDSELAEMLKVSIPTVKRWVSGETCPHDFGRKPILDFLESTFVLPAQKTL